MADKDDSSPPNKRGRKRSSSSIYSSAESENDAADVMSLLKSLNKKMDKNLKATTDIKKEMTDLKRTVNNHDKRLSDAESGIQKLELSVNQITSENELIQIELKKLNLVFMGIQDDLEESQDQLYTKVQSIISKTTPLDIPLDTFYRLGYFNSAKNRPVKVKFTSMTQRNIIYSNRSNLLPPNFINEDLPYSTRKSNAILRNKKKEAINEGVPADEVNINYKMKQIAVKGQVFKVQSLRNGTLTLSPQSTSIRAGNFLGTTPSHLNQDVLPPDLNFQF